VESGLLDVCPRCSVEGDKEVKLLRRCPFCGEYFCEEHVEPRLVMSFQAYQRYVTTYKDIANVLREHWQSPGGHPCPAYTRHFWRDYQLRKEEQLTQPRQEPVRARRTEVEEVRRSVVDEEPPILSLPVKQTMWEKTVVKRHEEVSDRARVREVTYKRKNIKALAIAFVLAALALIALLFTDTDGDNLVLADELAYGTNPFSMDSDGDSVSDGYEVLLGINPLSKDTDGDGLSDRQELDLGTNPLSKDTDADELNDYYEVKNKLNPLLSDTDGDGLKDGEEVLNYRTNPLDPDSDDDLLRDGDEVLLGTNPLLNDTDEDELIDGYEIKIGTNPLKNWRFSFNDDSLKSALSSYFRNRISHLAALLKGSTEVKTVWSILEWIDNNIHYDEGKSLLSNPRLYAPHETAQLRRGICTDYALLTASLLLEAGFMEVYVLTLRSSLGGHASVAVIVNSVTYVIDQHLPPRELNAYIRSRGWKIESVYRVRLNREREPEVDSLSPYSLPQRGSGVDERQVVETLFTIFTEHNSFIRWDENLRQCVYSIHARAPCILPYGYLGGICYSMSLNSEVLSRDFLYLYLKKYIITGTLLNSVQSYNRVYIIANYYGNMVNVTICFARI